MTNKEGREYKRDRLRRRGFVGPDFVWLYDDEKERKRKGWGREWVYIGMGEH